MNTYCGFLILLSLFIQVFAVERISYIAADEVIWDYVPSNADGASGMTFNVTMESESSMGEAAMWVVPSAKRVGKQYLKVLYREYTDETFQTIKPRAPEWEHLGYLGPILRAEVGDTIRVLFRNNARQPHSMHPHGVFYDKENEGVSNMGGAAKPHSGMMQNPMGKTGNSVSPNETWMYTWPVPERAGPAPNDLSSIVWMYHSHVDEVRDTNSGLVGAIIVTGAGMADQAGKPLDVTREFVVMFTVLDENWSWYLEDNIRTLPAGPINKSELMMDEEFIMSNKKHSVNGLLYSNLKGLSMMQNDTVRWHVIAIGDEVDIHGVHWHGETLVSDGHRVDTMELIPASMKTLDMVPDNAGRWSFHCHTNHHIMGGMSALFDVMPCETSCPRVLSSATTLGAGLTVVLLSLVILLV